MLTVAKVRGTAAAPYAEYLIAPMKGGAGDRGDYYLNKHGRQEAPGRWALGPRGHELLGVEADRPVTESELRNMLAVRFPNDPERELRPVGGNGRATAAIDATFSAPKSVSVVWALGSEETRRAIEEAHERSVDAALAHAVEHVPMLRRRVDRETVVRERAVELVATVFRHTTARAVDGRPPDPQLHSHVLLHGALRAGGERVAAIESRALMVHQRELAALYRGELADRLRELGYAIERNTGRDGRYFEIRGVPHGVTERFSSRHRQVQDRIEWRKQERLVGLRELAELDGERGVEARRRLERLEGEFADLCGAGKGNQYGEQERAQGRPGRAELEYELLERTEGLWRLAGRVDWVGERARAKLGEIERYGDRLSPAQERMVAKESRAPKGLETHGDLDRHWGEAAAAHDFDSRDVEALACGELEQMPGRQHLLRQVAAALTAHRATFVEREARAVAFEAASSRCEAKGLLSELAERGQVIALEDARFTTEHQRSLERHAMRHVDQLAAGRVDRVPQDFVETELRRLAERFEAGDGVAPEQERAIRAACSDRQLIVIQGQAGTGKSTALIAAARAQHLAGRRTIVTSTGGQAAERLAAELRAAGVHAEGCSTRALEAEVEHGLLRLGPDTTLIHEECALASTAEQNFVFWACKEGGARLLEVGDRDQNNPVGAGGLMELIEETAVRHGSFVALEQIVRARDRDDHAMQRALRVGDTERAVANLESRGRIVIAATPAEAAQAAVELWAGLRSEPGGALVLSEATNEQLDELNAELQAIRLDARELGEEGMPVAGRPYALHRGDRVVVRAQFEHPGVGKVRNGELGTIAALEDGHVVVELGDEQRVVRLDVAGVGAADLRLAYAQHPHPAQGVTTGHAVDLVGPLATRRGQYVSLTRGRDSQVLVTNYEDLGVEPGIGRDAALAALAQQLDRDEPEMPSLHFAELPTRAAARQDALRLVRRVVGEEHLPRVTQRLDRRTQAVLADRSVAYLAERAEELQRLLAEFPKAPPRERIALSRGERLRESAAAQRVRLDGTRAERAQLGRLRRRERAQLDQRLARQQEALATTECMIAELAATGAKQPDADRWLDRHAGDLAEYIETEAELGQRFSTEYERALGMVRRQPPRVLIDKLGERPRHGVERELWDSRAVRFELHRIRYGDLDRGRDPAPSEWCTAPTELARTAPDRPEPPAAGRLAPEVDSDVLDLGP